MNKGFTMLEVLIVLLIGSFLLTQSELRFNSYTDVNAVLSGISTTQIKAILSMKRVCYAGDNLLSDYNICFNGKGNSNRAQTISVASSWQQKIVIQLGFGKHYPQS